MKRLMDEEVEVVRSDERKGEAGRRVLITEIEGKVERERNQRTKRKKGKVRKERVEGKRGIEEGQEAFVTEKERRSRRMRWKRRKRQAGEEANGRSWRGRRKGWREYFRIEKGWAGKNM